MKYLKIGHLFAGGDGKKDSPSLILCYRDMAEILKFQQYIEYKIGICSYIEYKQWQSQDWEKYSGYHYDLVFLKIYFSLKKKRDSAKDFKAYAYFDRMIYELYEERKTK